MIRPATDDGLFHAGNPLTGERGTPITAAFMNALLEAVIGGMGDTVTSAVEVTLTEADGTLFAQPAEGATVLYHLPAYADCGALKGFWVKNTGQGIARLDAADAKTVDNAAYFELNPGDRCQVKKDGTNWQTL